MRIFRKLNSAIYDGIFVGATVSLVDASNKVPQHFLHMQHVVFCDSADSSGQTTRSTLLLVENTLFSRRRKKDCVTAFGFLGKFHVAHGMENVSFRFFTADGCECRRRVPNVLVLIAFAILFFVYTCGTLGCGQL